MFNKVGQAFGGNPFKATKLAIQDDYATSVKMSSWYDDNTKAYKLDSTTAWAASEQTCKNNEQDYIQVDFSVAHAIVGIDIRGSKSCAQWVTKFKLMGSGDGHNFSYACNGQ